MYSYQDDENSDVGESVLPPMPIEEPSRLQQFLARMGSGADRLQDPSLQDDPSLANLRLYQPVEQDLSSPENPDMQTGAAPAMLPSPEGSDQKAASQPLRLVDFQKQQQMLASPSQDRPVRPAGPPPQPVQPAQTAKPTQPAEPAQPATPAAQAGGSNVRVIDRQGNITRIPRSGINEARKNGRMLTPDNGVRMITPDGQITYALPEEVDQFRASGHVLLNDNGYFRVDPLPGEGPSDTMARAARIAKNLPPDVLQRAIAAEKKTFTGKRIAATLGAAATMGVAGPAAIAGVGELVAPAGVTEMVGTGVYDAAGREIMREAVRYGPSVLRRVVTSRLGKKAVDWLGHGAVGAAVEEMGRELLNKWRGKK